MVHPGQALTAAGLAVLVGALATTAAAHGDVHVRIDALDAEIALHPDDASRWIERGKLHGLDGAWSLAARDFARARELAPRDGEAPFQLARAELELGAPERALDALATLPPEHTEGMRLRGRALAEAGRHDEAAAALSAAIAAAPRPGPDLFVARATSLSRAGRHDDAIAGLEAGVAQLGPVVTLVQAAYELEHDRARYAAALAWIERLEAPLRGSPRWLVERAVCLAALGRGTEARTTLGEARAALRALPPARAQAPAMQRLEARLGAVEATLTASGTPPTRGPERSRLVAAALVAVASAGVLWRGTRRRRGGT